MASINKVIIIGNLGKEPDLRYTPSGAAVCNIAVATTRSWKDKTSGGKVEETEWHRIVFYDKLAEIAGEYLKKGKPVYVEGRLKTRKWHDKEGVEKYTTEIVADNMQMLGGRDDSGESRPAHNPIPKPSAPSGSVPARPAMATTGTGFDDMDSEIPW